MRELKRLSVVHLVKVSPFSVLVVKGNISRAGPARTGANTALTCAMDTINYHVHFVNEVLSPPDGIHYLLDLKSRFLQPPSTN